MQYVFLEVRAKFADIVYKIYTDGNVSYTALCQVILTLGVQNLAKIWYILIINVIVIF
jgi:hypothetical protein